MPSQRPVLCCGRVWGRRLVALLLQRTWWALAPPGPLSMQGPSVRRVRHVQSVREHGTGRPGRADAVATAAAAKKTTMQLQRRLPRQFPSRWARGPTAPVRCLRCCDRLALAACEWPPGLLRLGIGVSAPAPTNPPANRWRQSRQRWQPCRAEEGLEKKQPNRGLSSGAPRKPNGGIGTWRRMIEHPATPLQSGPALQTPAVRTALAHSPPCPPPPICASAACAP